MHKYVDKGNVCEDTGMKKQVSQDIPGCICLLL